MLDEEQVRAAVALMRELGIVEFHTGGNVLVLGPGAVPERRAAPTVKLPAVGEMWTQAQIDSIRSTRPEVARSIEAIQKEDAQPDEGPPLGPPAIPDASAPPGSAGWWAAFHLKHGRDPTPAEMSAAARGPVATGHAAVVVGSISGTGVTGLSPWAMSGRTDGVIGTGQGIYACSSCGCGVVAPGMCSACHDNGGKSPPPTFTLKPQTQAPGVIGRVVVDDVIEVSAPRDMQSDVDRIAAKIESVLKSEIDAARDAEEARLKALATEIEEDKARSMETP
jgi:hypothetical protein